MWHKRKLFNDLGTFRDRVTYYAMEGSTLTLLGAVKYVDGEFRIDDCLGIIGGGQTECLDFISRKMFDSQTAQTTACFFLAGTLFGLGATIYFWWRSRREAKNDFQMKLQLNKMPSLDSAGKGAITCVICMVL